MRSLLAWLMIVLAPPAYAHDAATGWSYDAFCCNGSHVSGDCQTIPSRSVRVTRNGYEITVGPGDHRLVTRRHDFTLPQSNARRSQDEEYHLCLFPDEDTLRCFYAPDMGY
ncbi:hypothetical protein [Ciceribacter thiooxidans]|uniref:Uncharacterized protein n=1 Tax=Ciceribacter thiooxidans TaxID=1969821 RepID=A0ABV7I235_9HYPH|nr:hypothetical protein [Ciceribacter thiooxidans]